MARSSNRPIFGRKSNLGKHESKRSARLLDHTKKLAVEPQRRMTQLLMKTAQRFKIKREEGQSEEDIKKIISEKITSGEIEYDPYDEMMQETLRIAFMDGVHDHNFDDADGNKTNWDEILFKQFLEYYPVLIEILQVVQNYNKAFDLPEKKSENSET